MASITETDPLDQWAQKEYEWGFVTDIESETLPPGLDEGVIRHISGM